MYTPIKTASVLVYDFFCHKSARKRPKAFYQLFSWGAWHSPESTDLVQFLISQLGSETWGEKMVSNNLPALGESPRRKSPQDPGRLRAWINPAKDNLQVSTQYPGPLLPPGVKALAGQEGRCYRIVWSPAFGPVSRELRSVVRLENRQGLQFIKAWTDCQIGTLLHRGLWGRSPSDWQKEVGGYWFSAWALKRGA